MLKINTLALMFVGTDVVILRFLVISKIRIMDTYWGNILPMAAMPVGLFLLKQFIDDVSDSLIEAAQVSGAKAVLVYDMAGLLQQTIGADFLEQLTGVFVSSEFIYVADYGGNACYKLSH